MQTNNLIKFNNYLQVITMVYKILISKLVLIYILLVLTACNKNGPKPCKDARYIFTVNTTWLTSDSVYQIGDTLFAQSSFPSILKNIDGNLVNYTNSVGIGSNIFFLELDSVSKQAINGINSFSFFEKQGTAFAGTTGSKNFINTNYILIQDSFMLKIGFIAKRKGLFALGLSDLGSQGLSGQNCTNASFINTVTNVNRHLNYFEFAIGTAPRLYENERYFCFRVL